MKKIKQCIFDTMQVDSDGSIASKIFDIFIIGLILLNVVTVIADTFSLPATLIRTSRRIEIFSVVFFTIEYILRLWTSDMLYPNLNPVIARIRYAFSFMALVDIFAILPTYLPMLIPVDLRVLRLLRIMRLMRIFKFNRYTSALTTITTVLKDKSSQLISSTFVVMLLLLISSMIMYGVENPAQPTVFTNAFSGLWWAISAFTTIGYGDIIPITTMGKILSGIISMLGIGLVAIPTGIISAGFMELTNKEKESHDDQKHYCPYCGKKLD